MTGPVRGPQAGPAALDVFGCALGGTQLIEASAGTGKTWTICGLYLRLLLERPLTVQQILVVTFTKAATAELRERIRQRLVDVLAALRDPAAPAAADPFVIGLLARLRGPLTLADADLARRLDEALQTFDEAAIFTIHGFCQRALADTPFAAGLPLVQELLQDDDGLRREVVHDFWRRQVAGGGADAALVAHLLARGDTPDTLARLLRRQMARPLSRLVWPAGLDGPDDAKADAKAVQSAFDAARALWRAGAPALLDALLAGRSRLNGNVYRVEGVRASHEEWRALLAADGPPAAPPGDKSRLPLFGCDKIAASTKAGQQPPAHPFFDAAKALLDALQRRHQGLARARLRLIRQLLTEGAEALREAKRQRRVVAFDDMLFNLHQRLQGPRGPALAAALRQRFPAALIDEFQDTDPLQFEVFRAIHGMAGGDDAHAPPLFLVGDPKQAIYSFRHADLHTYLRARDSARAQHTLLANQRSTQPLIDALNTLFGHNPQAFVQPGLAYHAVAKGQRPQPLLRDDSAPRAPLQVWTLPRPPGSTHPIPKSEALATVAQVCAGEITRLLTEAAAGRIALGEQALRAGDIAVLVRTHAQGSRVRQALAALGVGSVELSQASVFSTPDAEELARVLAAMLSPGREGFLKAALATRWHGQDAAQIDALGADEAALSALLQRFAGYQALWRQRGVGLMLRQWLQAEGVARRLLAAADGERRLTNLLHLAEALHQAATEHASPEALLRWLQAQREGGASGDDATQLRLESDRNLVQIVTIHKSKGLEYPVVFCPFLWDGRLRLEGSGLDGAARHDDTGEAVIDFRAGLDESFDAEAARAEARQEAAAEGMRLVYVALTRARHRCYLVAGAYRTPHGKHWSVREAASSTLNWLVAPEGLSHAAWTAPKRPLPAPPAAAAAIDAAWAALAAGLPAAAGAGPALAVAPLPAPWRQPLPPPAAGALGPQALPPPAVLPAGWWIGSYSALLQGAGRGPSHGSPGDTDTDADADTGNDSGISVGGSPDDARAGTGRAAADHDLRAMLRTDADDGEAPASAPPRSGVALAADDILRFPRGAAAGDCVHAALEWAEFTRPETWPAAVERALRQYPPGAADPAAEAAGAWPAMLQRLLADLLGTPLPAALLGTAAPLRLADLPPARRQAEFEFHLPVPHLAAADLQAALAGLGYEVPALDFRTLQGYLKGFIDLVFEHGGRYFIADWKSNHLGDTPDDYAAAPVAAAMGAHHYHLQYLLYSVALHRWLQHRLPGYAPQQHLGGVLYLFVRGVRPHWHCAPGRPAGVFFHRPETATIECLSALLGGEVPPP